MKYYTKNILWSLLVILQINQNLLSQSLKVKETYDLLEKNIYNMNLYSLIDSVNVNKIPLKDTIVVPIYDALLGDRFAHVFSSFLTMYKTTGDKGYLHKFISQTYFVQQFRNDKQMGGVNPNKGWWQIVKDGNLTQQIYFDGNTISPMAEYCFKIKYDPDFIAIANTPLPSCTSLDIDCAIKWPQQLLLLTETMPIGWPKEFTKH